MSLQALAAGLRKYAGFLVATILFPLLWMKALRLARRHTDDDPRGPLKVMAGIGIGVLLALGGVLLLQSVESSARVGFYDSLDTRLQQHTGESAYQDRITTIEGSPAQIAAIERQFAAADDAIEENATRVEAGGGDPETDADYQKAVANRQALTDARDGIQAKLDLARNELSGDLVAPDGAPKPSVGLRENHELYLRLAPLVEARDDEAIQAEVDEYVAGTQEDEPNVVVEVRSGRIARDLEIKDKAETDMRTSLLVFGYTSVVGAFFAPLALALGSIVKNAFVPSDSVGYKPYPGIAAGLFLLLGAFGPPALPFAAWTFMDLEQRSVEGQISL